MHALLLLVTLPGCFEYAFNKNKDESHPGNDTFDIDTGDGPVDSAPEDDTCPGFDFAPEERLAFAGAVPEALDRAEAWIPRTILMEWLRSISGGEPAHRLLARLQAWAPLGDAQLLAGLQALVEDGALKVGGQLQR